MVIICLKNYAHIPEPQTCKNEILRGQLIFAELNETNDGALVKLLLDWQQ